MVKGFVFTGIVAAGISLVALMVASPSHQLTLGLSAGFAATATVLAALLGAAVALIYHLSHLGDVRHAIQRSSASRATPRPHTPSA
jgi:hypothetical protein